VSCYSQDIMYYKNDIACYFMYNAYNYAHPFNGPLSGTTRVSWYQKGKTNLDFTEARDSEWQRGHMQVCTSLQTDTTRAPHCSVFYRPDALPATQPTATKHWRQMPITTWAVIKFCCCLVSVGRPPNSYTISVWACHGLCTCMSACVSFLTSWFPKK